MQESFII